MCEIASEHNTLQQLFYYSNISFFLLVPYQKSWYAINFYTSKQHKTCRWPQEQFIFVFLCWAYGDLLKKKCEGLGLKWLTGRCSYLKYTYRQAQLHISWLLEDWLFLYHLFVSVFNKSFHKGEISLLCEHWCSFLCLLRVFYYWSSARQVQICF